MVNLMGYSVLVDNEEQARELQKIAFEQGFEWRFGGKVINVLDGRSFQFGLYGEKIITWVSNGEHYQDYFITKTAHFKDLFEPKFTPISMKCTQEQFDAIMPKLRGCVIRFMDGFPHYNYLVNNAGDVENVVTNVSESRKSQYNRTVHEEWNENLFLKACGIEVDTLEQQLERAKVEVERLKKAIEDSKFKDGDWCTFWNHDKSKTIIAKFQGSKFACMTSGDYFLNCEKITNPELIKLLENEIK